MSDGATEMLREQRAETPSAVTRCPGCGRPSDQDHSPDCKTVAAFRMQVDRLIPEAEAMRAPALARQEGGGHYKSMAIQPIEYIHKNGIGFAEGCVIKYVSRWRAKGGVEDLRKARHFLDLLIEMEDV